ncbi:490_t:CDS:2, partial [Cetraspora pellucida]
QNLNLITYQIKEKLDEYWPIMQETTKIAAFFDLHFKRIVYHKQSYQFIQEYANTYMPITGSDSDELIQYWETIAPPEEIF